MSIASPYSSGRAISATAGYLGIDVYSPNVAISARGDKIAIEALSLNRAISAYSPIIGIDVGSANVAISAQGSRIGIEVFSPNRALSAYGRNLALEVYSDNRAISAFGNRTGLEVYSNNQAISAFSTTVGAYIYSSLTGIQTDGRQVAGMFSSPTVSLSTGGGGYNELNSRTGIYCIPTDKDVVGTPFSPVLAVKGNSYFDGGVTITGDLSTLGSMSYLDTKVVITSSLYVENKGTDAAATIIQTGAQPILVCYDKDESLAIPSLIVDGAKQGNVGINVSSPSERLTINGNISGYNNQISLGQGKAVGNFTTAFGNTTASGDFAFSEGYGSRALGKYSHASGYNTLAEGDYSTAIGFNTSALKSGEFLTDGQLSFVGGSYSVAKNRYAAFVFGTSNQVTHDQGVALGGSGSITSGPRAHAHGVGAIASGYESFVEGTRTGTGNRVPFESYNPVTKTFTFSPENSAIFFGEFFGNLQITLRGCITSVSLSSFHDGDFFDIQVQPNSLLARTATNEFSALGVFPLSGGQITWPIGSGKGWIQNGSGWESHAEGFESVASGWRSSHAEGTRTLASGNNGSHSEGYETIASGVFGSHAEGRGTIASGDSSHAEGRRTVARGIYSHAAGYYAQANHDYSYAWAGDSTLTNTVSTTRTEQYMISALGGVFIPGNVGIGTDNNTNKLTVNGNISASNHIYAGNQLIFGTLASQDTNLFRRAPNTLETDGNFNVDANLTTLGNLYLSSNLLVSQAISATTISERASSHPTFTGTTINVDLNGAPYQIIPIALNNTIINFGGFVPGRTSQVLLSSIATTNLTINPTPANLLYLDGRPTTLANTKVILFEFVTFGTSVSSVVVKTKIWP
jgi:hypothetical protein